MDLSDIGRVPAERTTPGRFHDPGRPGDVPRWPDLVARLGAEIAGPLTNALERIHTLTHTGKIDRAGLRALREEVEAARLAGMVGQQLTRFIDARIRQSPERMALAEVVGGVATHRAREAVARGVTLVATGLDPVEVIVDAPLLFGLLNATVDWALANAAPASAIELSVETRGWPASARLGCRFVRLPAPADGEERRTTGGSLGGESLAWWLLDETARALGVMVERRLDNGSIHLTLDFPRRSSLRPQDASTAPLDSDDGFSPSSNSQPLAGCHVLVIASRRELRTQVREALRHMSLIVDFVASIDEAAGFCREGLPHAVIVESIQVGERFAEFRAELTREVSDFVFVEIVEEGTGFEMSGFNGTSMARVGRQALASSLPSALLFELSPRG